MKALVCRTDETMNSLSSPANQNGNVGGRGLRDEQMNVNVSDECHCDFSFSTMPILKPPRRPITYRGHLNRMHTLIIPNTLGLPMRLLIRHIFISPIKHNRDRHNSTTCEIRNLNHILTRSLLCLHLQTRLYRESQRPPLH